MLDFILIRRGISVILSALLWPICYIGYWSAFYLHDEGEWGHQSTKRLFRWMTFWLAVWVIVLLVVLGQIGVL